VVVVVVVAAAAILLSSRVPRMLFCVNWNELPNELSTCVCAAKCTMVSMFSVAIT